MVNFRGRNENQVVFDKILQQKPANLMNLMENTESHSRVSAGINLAASDRGKLSVMGTATRPLRLYSPEKLVHLRQEEWTKRWINREMSTFEYLIHLNTAAGRTYNDLTQYPVFPWVLADYTSCTLDLTDPNVYRDLSKPIGALNEDRLRRFTERMNHYEPSCRNEHPFLYGSHYSSVGTVLYYLLRLEPFASYAKEMQGGRFDHADRLFHSVEETWRNCMLSDSDLKELTPEWYYFPDLFVNRNDLDLGERQDGTKLGDVQLPPWANNSPDKFVRLNMEALEGDYVSENIHNWIDLIFGYKQKGPEAAKSNNLFYYLTYEDAVDLDTVSDPVLKRSIEAQIANFGQTPAQLFTRPHPRRVPVRPPYFKKARTLHTSSLHISQNLSPQYIAKQQEPVVLLFPPSSWNLTASQKALEYEKSALINGTIEGEEKTNRKTVPTTSDLSPERAVSPTNQMDKLTHALSAAVKLAGANTKETKPPVKLEEQLERFFIFQGSGQLSRFDIENLHIKSKEKLVIHNPWPQYGPRTAFEYLVPERLQSRSWLDYLGMGRQTVLLGNGTAIATCGHVDNTVKIHSTLDGRLLQCVKVHSGSKRITSISIDETYSMLLATCQDGTFVLWRLIDSSAVEETVKSYAKEEAERNVKDCNTQLEIPKRAVSMPEQDTVPRESTSSDDEDDDSNSIGDPRDSSRTNTWMPGALMNKLWSAFRGKKVVHVPVLDDAKGPLHWCAGFHSNPITAALVNLDLDVVCSASLLETHIVLHTASDGGFLRTIDIPSEVKPGGTSSVVTLAVSSLGHIIVHKVVIEEKGGFHHQVNVVHINGRLLVGKILGVSNPIIYISVFHNAKHVLIATTHSVAIYSIETLEIVLDVVQSEDTTGVSPIRAVALTPDELGVVIARRDQVEWYCIKL